jgi:type I restriction enzyme S subunit
MIEELKPYTSYQASQIAWAPRLPEHWTVRRAKTLFDRVKRPVQHGAEVVTCFRDGTVTLRSKRRLTGYTEAIFELGYQGIRRGDLVIHAMDAFAGAVGVSDSDGKASPVYAACVPRDQSVPEYYALVIRQMAHSQWILALAKGIRERSTDFRFEVFGTQLVPVPPPDEQAAIVRFLDHANRRIDLFIRAKKRLISLLNEQKQAIIHRAVTRGLDPSARLKDSGLPWLGLIPAHWELRRAKQVCSTIIDCKNRTPERVEGGQYRVIRTTNIRNGDFSIRGSYPTDERHFLEWTARGAPRVGDVFFTREAPAGEACLVPDIPGICMGQRMMYFRPNPDLLAPKFLVFSVYGPVGRTYIEHACNGSTVGHLRLGQVSAFPLLWCPVPEQLDIVRHIEESTRPQTLAVRQAEREISLAREYRTRLVADVVTGQLDVRAAAAGLPVVEPATAPTESVGDETDIEDGEAA